MLADITNPGLLFLLVRAAVFADVELAVQTLPLGVDQKSKGRAASDAAVFIKLLMLR